MLAELHQVDQELKDIEQEKGDLPEMIRRLETEITERENELEQFRSRIAELGSDRRSIDGRIQMARVKQEKYKEQLYSVTTNREYDAIQQEIESIDKQVEVLENTQMALLEEEEEHNTKMKQVEERIELLKEDLKDRKSELQEKTQDSESEELELQHERDKLTVRIKKPILAHYERIRAAREGVGASHLYAGACGTCFAVVPPQRQAEIRKMEDIILCESCGVIMLPEEEYFEDGQ
ncbi:hypothetical protein GF324_10440 [bacterium]|nr:hypothetical protein [bacterium]